MSNVSARSLSDMVVVRALSALARATRYMRVEAPLVLAAAALLVLVAASSETTAVTDASDELDDEPDTAPFAIAVQSGDGRRCSGALVSLHSALTWAGCVEGGALRAGPEGGAGAGGRVVRVAEARGEGGAAGLAVLELEAAPREARPILMATSAAECAPGAHCHVVGARHIHDATLAATARCVSPHAALCVAGPALCASDEGAGVVCGGKLCGVLGAAPPTPAECDGARAVLDVTRARRFLHCAHTLRACGRDGECAELCSERELTPRRTAPPPPPAPTLTSHHESTSASLATRTHERWGTPTRSEPPPASAPTPPPQRSSRPPSFEFEPNRPDFKAGEYGDNAADYSGDESAAGAGLTTGSEAGGATQRAVPTAGGAGVTRSSSLAAQRAWTHTKLPSGGRPVHYEITRLYLLLTLLYIIRIN